MPVRGCNELVIGHCWKVSIRRGDNDLTYIRRCLAKPVAVAGNFVDGFMQVHPPPVFVDKCDDLALFPDQNDIRGRAWFG